jgi:hypothetical protein
MINDFALVIVSSKKYNDVLPVTLKQYENISYFSNIRKYLVCNSEIIINNKWNIINFNEDVSWSDNLIYALASINENYLILFLEDIYLEHILDINLLENALRKIKNDETYFVKFECVPTPLIEYDNDFSIYELGAPYSVSVLGFWNKVMLDKLLSCGENAWDFELNASYRSKILKNTFSTNRPIFQYINLIEKGKWHKDLSKEFIISIGLNHNKRKFNNYFGICLNKSKTIIFFLMNKIDWKIRVKFVLLIKKFLATY